MSSPEVANWIKGKKLTQKLLERLKTTLYAVQAFLSDAEQKQIKERAVKDWLDSLKDAMYVADDLLDEVFTKAATQKDPGKHLVGSVVEAITNTQLTCLTSLCISDCSSHIWFPVSAIPPSLRVLMIQGCRELEFQMDGQHHSLQKLYIGSSCDSVASFSLLDAFPNVKNVDIKYCGNMECIVVSRPLSSLRYLCITHCGSLKSVSTLWMAAPQLEQLSLVACPEIDLSDTGHPHRSPRYLCISYSEKLVTSVAFMNSQFHGITSLSIEGGYNESVSVKCLPKEGWLPASLESLTLISIESLETLECKGLAHLTSLHELSIYGCPKLENMEGEKLPASIKLLIISGSPLLGKRCEMKDPQIWPKISV